ncbi:hypothetical protein KsCSTR_47640 [Candidatus Kuenenia stuttgartiensis]|uniref:GDP-mannose pyrophosphatase n=2 Tax=Candidatus Brocadiaceae TaxID=1127830 RepID=A0A6G7GXF2_KUEST|nr:hypothetical protein KsCSTR_47640 [Candidatus Kuenenia stuttgartiensis]
MAKVNQVHKVFETNWFSLEAVLCDFFIEPYYRLSCNDSVSIIAKTSEEKIILIRQYRPPLETFTLELPSGYIDKEELPEDAIKRELKEETRFVCNSVDYLGTLKICPSRINNTLHVFFGKDASLIEETKQNEDKEVEVVLAAKEEISRMILKNEFVESSGIAVFFLAQLKGYL